MSNSWRANNRRFYRSDSQIIIVKIQFIVNERLIKILCVVMWSSNQKLIEDLFKTVSVIRAIAHTGRVTGAGGGRFNGHWAPVIHKSNRRLAVSNTGLRFQYTGAGPGPGHSLDNISISHSRSICASISCLYMRDYPLLWQLQVDACMQRIFHCRKSGEFK